MKNLLCKIFLIITVVTALFTIAVSADAADGFFETYWESPDVTPPEETHPRVFFTAEDIPTLRANLAAEENSLARIRLMRHVAGEFNYASTKTYSESRLAVIESGAYYYALYADTLGQEELEDLEAKILRSIEHICIIDYKKDSDGKDLSSENSSRIAGRCLSVLSEIYDWCYPIIEDNEELKNKIIDKCIEFAKNLESWDNGDNNSKKAYAPSKLYAIAGHGAEKEFLRDLLCFAIAVYDERPDVWESVGGRFYEEYVPVNSELLKSGYYHTGTDYGPGRAYATCCAYFLITGMGADEPWSGELMSKLGYQEIYTRRPDGNVMYDGDIYSDTIPPFTYKKDTAYGSMFMYAAAGKDEYLKAEQFRQDLRFGGGALVQNFIDQSPVLFLIINNIGIEPKDFSELPHSRYFPGTAGVMMARTGWDDGVDSDAVIASFKVNTQAFADHLHLDSGHFNIYYKGLLAADSGNYHHYGDLEHGMYTVKSIAHNTILVDDPSEGVFYDTDEEYLKNSYISNINDGGQNRYGGYGHYNIDEFINKSKSGVVLANEIDPKHTQKPYYTYLKGDLKKAYSDKVQEFKRSFMFLDLKDEEIPAALIVFDKVVSSDATFKKTWLIHGVNSPIIDKVNKTSTFTNTDTYGDVTYNGQMIVETLLPENVDYDVVGGPGEWGFVRRFQYNDADQEWKETKRVNFGDNTYEDKTENNERNTYRVEISPTTPSKENHFFNVILIGDAGQEISIDAPLYVVNDFYGTKVKDRVVFFSRDGEEKDSFSYTLTGSGQFRYTICDMEAGKYTVTVDGETPETVYVSEDGGVLSFTAYAGAINAQKIDDTYIKPADEDIKTSSANVYVMQNNVFTKPLNIAGGNDETLVSAEDTAKMLGYKVDSSEKVGKNIVKIYDGLNHIATVQEGSKRVFTRGGILNLTYEPSNETGKCTMKLSDLLDILFESYENKNFANTLFVHKTDKVPNAVYASGYVDGSILKVNAKIYNAYTAKVICALKNGEELIEAVPLTDIGNGCFSGSIDISGLGEYEVQIYAWSDGLYPFTTRITSNETTGTGNYNLGYEKSGDGSLKITKVENGLVKKVTKTKIASETNVYTQGTGISEGILHYSTNLKINKLYNGGDGEAEILYFAVRGKKGTLADVIRYYQPENFDGLELKIDCIVDMDENKVYIYENGVLSNEVSVGWTEFMYFQHYVSDRVQKNTDTDFELIDSFTIQYPTGTHVDTVKNNVGKFVILK